MVKLIGRRLGMRHALAAAVAVALPVAALAPAATTMAADTASPADAYVQPITWQRFGHPPPADDNATMVAQALLNASKYGLTTWWQQRYASQTGQYLNLGGVGEAQIRQPASEAYAIAVALANWRVQQQRLRHCRVGKIVYRCGDVLIHDPRPAGGRDRSSQPPEHAATISAGDTANTAGPTRGAPPRTPLCATASPTGLPAGTRRSTSAPAAARRSSSVNATRIGSACAANRDNQPRTVDAGHPTSVIFRQPRPAARAVNASQITATSSVRRPSANRGNNTCERPQPTSAEQIARRGRNRRTIPPATRTNRAAAHPHGATRCPQSGQDSSPETS